MGRPIRILQVEDNADDVELIAHELRSGGFDLISEHVETADGLRIALARGGWDAIISDYSLPSFDAIAALGVMRGLGFDLPFIVVTGTIGEDRAVELMRAGAHDFILKDQLGRLTGAVERAIGDAGVRADRARTLEHLRVTNHALATLVEASPLAIFVVAGNGLVLSWNPAAERLSGWSASEVVGHEVPTMSAEVDTGFAAMRTQACHGRSFTAQVMSWRRKDGKQIDVSLSMAPLRLASESESGCLGIAEDITERKRLEHMLMQSQKMEAIGLLAGGVAHDFNNLLGVILGFGDRLVLRIPPEDPCHRPAVEICRAAERASVLTRQLLSFSRKQTTQAQPTDLNELVRRTEGMLRRVIGEDIAMQAQLAPVTVTVVCDPNQIEMVLMNLVVNARDAMPTGGMLTIATQVIDVDGENAQLANVSPGRYVVLSVTDTGTGMDAATRERMFEPFFTTKERGRGTGLGLSTVFGIVKQSAGWITVTSEVGCGTTFYIHLPLVQQVTIATRMTESAAINHRGTETILVVEDEDGLRSLICEQLQTCGYVVLVAPHAEAAIERCRTYPGPIHMLLTDVILPGMSGVLLAKRLIESHGNMRVLYMSGYTDDAIVRHGIPISEKTFIEKPFRLHDLLDKIHAMLSTGGEQS